MCVLIGREVCVGDVAISRSVVLCEMAPGLCHVSDRWVRGSRTGRGWLFRSWPVRSETGFGSRVEGREAEIGRYTLACRLDHGSVVPRVRSM